MPSLNHLDLPAEDRDERFSGAYSCQLHSLEHEGKVVPIRPLDVSRRGLGFVARESLKRGAYFWLQIGTGRFRVELAYCHSHLGIEGLYRCGLFLREADGDLHMICAKAGLLSDHHRRTYLAAVEK